MRPEGVFFVQKGGRRGENFNGKLFRYYILA
jgi:hypothetical protein